MYTAIIFIAAISLSKSSVINIGSKSKAFFRRAYTLLFLFVLGATEVNALAYGKLAKDAGLNHKTMKKIVKKMIKTESSSGSYYVKNKKSGAYGRYQIMPKTAKYYAKKLNITHSRWKKPSNQDKIFQAILRDNILSLKRNNIKVNAFSIYGAHQQGSSGFKAIVKNKKLTKRLEKNIRYNLPNRLRSVHRSKLRNTWIRYWKKRFA
ncbi:MAG: transglycosylase SLT domain-containing protein [Campylobacterota bacterium]|nr:transglycosylase SLT domain-containing protein [Campylobacterota bacterium]